MLDLDFSEEQEMLRDAVASLCDDKASLASVRALENDEKGYADDFWVQLAELGLAGALVPDASPGSPEDRYRLDIRLAARSQLLNAGLETEQLSLCPLCTVAEPLLFHSWRRDQVKAVQWSGIVAQA